MKVAKWGNSLAVRLPKETVDRLGLLEGDDLIFESSPAGDVKVFRKRDTVEWIRHMREKHPARLPADFKFDREEANRRGD